MWNNYNQYQPNNVQTPAYGNYRTGPYTNGAAAAPPYTASGQANNNIIWVQGKQSAKAWQLPPNSTVMLLDSEIEGQFYIKTSDNIGMSQLRVFKYTQLIDEQHQSVQSPSIDLSQYVTRNEVLEMLKESRNEQFVPTAKSTKSNTSTNKQQ